MKYLSLCVSLFIILCVPSTSSAFWSPGMLTGYQAIPFPGEIYPRGSVTVGIEFIHFWEDWGDLVLATSAHVESDFQTRATLAPRFIVEYKGMFRGFTAPVIDIGNPYALFAWRLGFSLGYRTTGRYADIRAVGGLRGGAFVYFSVDYRFRFEDQTPGQEWRFNFGARIEMEL